LNQRERDGCNRNQCDPRRATDEAGRIDDGTGHVSGRAADCTADQRDQPRPEQVRQNRDERRVGGEDEDEDRDDTSS
jgi:hypothetical protein